MEYDGTKLGFDSKTLTRRHACDWGTGLGIGACYGNGP